MRFEKKSFLIVSKCGTMVAKGVPRQRYICLSEENDKKRILTYSSKGKAINAMESSGFYLSPSVEKYVMNTYEEVRKNMAKQNRTWVSWRDLEELDIFEAREFIESYIEVKGEVQ